MTLGGKLETFAGLAGMGDLVLTCTGALSRNRSVGVALGRGKKLDEILDETKFVAEGVKTSKSAKELAERHGIEMPITTEMYRVLYENESPRAAIQRLMSRSLKAEHVTLRDRNAELRIENEMKGAVLLFPSFSPLLFELVCPACIARTSGTCSWPRISSTRCRCRSLSPSSGRPETIRLDARRAEVHRRERPRGVSLKADRRPLHQPAAHRHPQEGHAKDESRDGDGVQDRSCPHRRAGTARSGDGRSDRPGVARLEKATSMTIAPLVAPESSIQTIIEKMYPVWSAETTLSRSARETAPSQHADRSDFLGPDRGARQHGSRSPALRSRETWKFADRYCSRKFFAHWRCANQYYAPNGELRALRVVVFRRLRLRARRGRCGRRLLVHLVLGCSRVDWCGRHLPAAATARAICFCFASGAGFRDLVLAPSRLFNNLSAQLLFPPHCRLGNRQSVSVIGEVSLPSF